jgi:hypothetical protein
MKVKTSVTLSQELLEEIDHLPEYNNRSIFLEMAAWAYLEQRRREERERRDLEIINERADYLNAEMADVLRPAQVPHLRGCQSSNPAGFSLLNGNLCPCLHRARWNRNPGAGRY